MIDTEPCLPDRPRDTGRSAFYAAEAMAHNLFERSGPGRLVIVAGTTLTLPPEARFGSIESIERYVASVLAMAVVRTTFPRAARPVMVRARNGFRSAHYEPAQSGRVAEIAIPDRGAGAWALRELVVLHEVAHHLDASGGAAHGAGFVETLIELVGLVLGPEAAFVYRVIVGGAVG